MQLLEVSGAVRSIYGSLGFKRLSQETSYLVTIYVTFLSSSKQMSEKYLILLQRVTQTLRFPSTGYQRVRCTAK